MQDLINAYIQWLYPSKPRNTDPYALISNPFESNESIMRGMNDPNPWANYQGQRYAPSGDPAATQRRSEAWEDQNGWAGKRTINDLYNRVPEGWNPKGIY